MATHFLMILITGEEYFVKGNLFDEKIGNTFKNLLTKPIFFSRPYYCKGLAQLKTPGIKIKHILCWMVHLQHLFGFPRLACLHLSPKFAKDCQDKDVVPKF